MWIFIIIMIIIVDERSVHSNLEKTSRMRWPPYHHTTRCSNKILILPLLKFQSEHLLLLQHSSHLTSDLLFAGYSYYFFICSFF